MSELTHDTNHEPRTTDDENDEFYRVYDNWQEVYGGKDPYAGDEESKPHPDEVPSTEYEYDEDGAYNPAAGAQDQDAALRAGRCGAGLRRSEERYGEPRYCTRLPESVFVDGGSGRCYVHKEGGS